jgi:hypothetical protein
MWYADVSLAYKYRYTFSYRYLLVSEFQIRLNLARHTRSIFLILLLRKGSSYDKLSITSSKYFGLLEPVRQVSKPNASAGRGKIPTAMQVENVF